MMPIGVTHKEGCTFFKPYPSPVSCNCGALRKFLRNDVIEAAKLFVAKDCSLGYLENRVAALIKDEHDGS